MCVLHVTSNIACFDTFLASTTLPVYKMHRRGDVPQIGRRDKPYEDWGFSCTVSEKEFDDIDGQVRDAIEFLRLHAEELRKLTPEHSIDDIRLDFPLWCRLDERYLVQCDYLPPDLLVAAGKFGIGIEWSIYRRDAIVNQARDE